MLFIQTGLWYLFPTVMIMEQVAAEDKELIKNNSVLSLFERVIKEGAYPNMRMLRNDIEDAINFEILKARGIIQ